MKNESSKNVCNGERKRLSELKENSFFVFTDRKKMPCIYNGISTWKGNTIYLWSELKEHSRWTQFGNLWVIDYGNALPDELSLKRELYFMWK